MEDSYGTIWGATKDAGISRLIPSEDLFRPIPDNELKNTLILFEDSRKNLWVGTNGSGLYLQDRETKRLTQKIKPWIPKRMFQVQSIVEWTPGELLIASDEGLTRYNILTEEKHTLRSDTEHPNGLNDNYLHTLFIDRERALWIGSYFGVSTISLR